MRPRLRLSLVESKSRKAAFLREAVHLLEFGNTEVLSTRIEELDERYHDQADLLTVRAVKVDRSLWRTAATLLRADGRFLVFGSGPPAEQVGGFQAIEQLRLAGGASMLYVLTRAQV
jgi:16S rRNA G527 N7-methylase RsmG